MQMESWRERGFVPDSDDEDGIDSQEKGVIDEVSLVEIGKPVTKGVEAPVVEGDSAGHGEERNDDLVDGFGTGFEEEDQDAVVAVGRDIGLLSPVLGQQSPTPNLNDERRQDDKDNAPGFGPEDEGNDTGGGGEIIASVDPDNDVSLPERPQTPDDSKEPEEHSKSVDSRENVQSNLSLTPRPKHNRDLWDIPNSSPDLLQPDHHPWRKQTSPAGTPTPKAKDTSQPRPQDNIEDSPPTSPLSSVRSSVLDENSQQFPEEHPDQPLGTNPTLEELLDLPEDVLQELDQPTKRSLRQRNPIQLHPYQIEDAKYQRLMKARGVKPVRISHQEIQRARAAAAESQRQGSENDAGSSSDTQLTGYLPSSPIDTRELFALLPIDDSTNNATRSSQGPRVPNTEPRSPKRRRVIGPGDDRHRQALRPIPRPAAPQVVIYDGPSSISRTASSSFNLLSPPRSGSVSSPPAREDAGFRFPRGFSPPTITHRTKIRKNTKDVEEEAVNLDDHENQVHGESDESLSVRSASPNGRQTSDVEDDQQEDEEEAAVRRYQRKIKGVLPASWLRLDQQKQKPLPSATQRNNERMTRLEAEAAKGVARKVTRKPGSSAPSSAREQLFSLRQLADDSDMESGGDSDDADDVEGHRQLANMLGLDESILDQNLDEDIPEDNRIDYMFPTASRNRASAQRHKPAKKRKRPDKDGAISEDSFKRPRRKRQARLTDAIYEGQKTKKPPRSLPRLGILDAPDVVSQPRQKQPQFLRVAARKALSRHDRGRRSPSHKVIRLSSRRDTEDANVSLRDWRAGRLRQQALPRAPSRTPRRQPLRELSTNARDVFNHLSAKKANERSRTATRPATPRFNATEEEHAPTVDASTDPSSSARHTAPKPVQRRQGHTWIVQRNLAITSLSRINPRPVIPEIESHASTARASLSLQKSLARLGRDERLPLNRFLSGDAQPQTSIQTTTDLENAKPALPKPVTQRHRQLKKRHPKRLDITHIEDYAIPLSTSEERSLEPQSRGQSPNGRSTGQLNRFRTAYSVDFGVRPLPGGIFFHESTFIGSGEFSRAIDIAKRDHDTRTSFFTVFIGDQKMQWGSWDDLLSSQLGMAFDQILRFAETGESHEESDKISPAAADNGCVLYKSLINYASNALSFIDPIDRTGFVIRATSLISKAIEDLSIMITTAGNDSEKLIRISSYNVVFATQVCQVANHPLVNQTIQDEALGLVKSALKQVITLVSSSTGQAGVQRFLAASKLQELREKGIKDDHPVVEAWVIVHHLSRNTDKFRGCLEEFAADACSVQGAGNTNEKDIEDLENRWQHLFETQPLQEFDVLGISRIGSRFQRSQDNWTLVRRLLRPVLDCAEANSESQPISYYSYCRVLFHRCFILINDWGWRECKPILDTLYDFFAKRTLYNLRLEENYKSPTFLDELDHNPSFELLPGDPCFHILLKVIASGLRFLSKAYDQKKIRNYTWRLLPNHGRDYPKEQPIHQADLDALRNHHDLLSTLYSSVPDGCRPRLETIKALVHPATSHRETCKISLRTWTRLARFKLSTDEDLSGLEPFAEWHGYFVMEFVKQHSLARREIEAQNDGGKQFSQQLIDRTVAQNQRQIESLLKMALQGLQSAIKSAPTLEHAQKIVSQTPIKSILDLFDSRTPRLNATVSEGLQVIIMYLEKCSALLQGSTVRKTDNSGVSADEDSQDYGDWTDIAAAYGYESVHAPISSGVEHVEKVFHPAVSRLVSNCFGADRCPDDAILSNVVDCWTSVAHTLVTQGLRRWDSYISPYESESWISLRWTTQTRKFTPQFLAKCIEKDGKVFSECRVQILGMWMSSLVERVSMLKFQHLLTEAIMNHDAEDALLTNLPFSMHSTEGRYSITFVQLSQRRLSLISSLLSNMRAHIQDLEDARSLELLTTRHEYREIIQKMMSSMRSNYQELGNGEAEVQGAYVNFVHNIVGFLQQHSRDICPIDSFFTDPASFPLPSDDPTYIVARLKSYEPRISSPKVAKTLIIFIQSVSERAALDGQQIYLVNQLHKSMAESYEGGNPQQPTLRATLLQSVFPAYLAAAFDNQAAWILSRPIIETVTRVFQELLFNMDATDQDCVRSVLNIFSAIFASTYDSLHCIMTNVEVLRQPHVLITTAAFLDMLKATFPVVDYIERLTEDTSSNVDIIRSLMLQIRAFQHVARFIVSNTQSSLRSTTISAEALLADIVPPHRPTSDLFLAATRELKAYINESWSAHQGKCYFTRRGDHQPQEVFLEAPISVTLEDRPSKRLVNVAMSFLDALSRLGLCGEGELEEEAIHRQERPEYEIEHGHGRGYDYSSLGEKDFLIL